MQAEICRLKSGLICSGKESNTNARFMDDALKIRGVKYLNVETWLLFPPVSKFLSTRQGVPTPNMKEDDNK